ncbi:hypothetical protein LAZ67_3002003, partial [Cordylochernes scorpioides]
MSLEATNLVWAGSPRRAEHEPARLGSESEAVADLSAENHFQGEDSRMADASANYANLPIDRSHANFAAACIADVTPSTSGALAAATNWAEQVEAAESGEDSFTVVKHKRRRRESPNRPVEQRSSGVAASRRTGATPRRRPTAGGATVVQEIRATRADIADARVQQRSSTEDNCVFVEHCPDFGYTHYLQAVEELVGGAGNVLQVMKMDGHMLVGLSTKALAQRLLRDGLEIGHTHLRAFPFKKRAERITVANLPFFVDDAAVIEALRPYGDVTSIVPIRLRAGRYTFTDGRREVFILLKEGFTLEKIPTRVVIRNKGNVLSAFMSYGVKCSRCGRQGHRRANCPINPGRASNNGQPQPAPLPPGASSTVSRQQSRPTPAAPALPMEETPSAPPPVTPAPPLQAPEGPAPTPDVEMSIVEETLASSTSSAKNATRVDLDAFIEGHPSVSFAETDALGLGREEVLDLLSSRTKAQRKGPLLSPPQCDALAGLIGQILDLRPGAASNLYKVLGQVKAELRTTPAAVPTPPPPAPRPAETTSLALHGERTSPDIATPPPPLSCQFIDDRWTEADDILHELNQERDWGVGISESDITEAVIYPEDREPLIRRLSTRRRRLLAGFISAAIERARDSDPFVREGMSALRGDVALLIGPRRASVGTPPDLFCFEFGKMSRQATNLVWAGSPSKAEKKPVRHGSLAQPCAELSANQDLQNEIPIVLRKKQNYVNPPAGSQDANSAAPVDLAAIPTSNAAAQVRRNWADITEEVNPGAEEGFTLVQGRKRRRGSAISPTAAAPSSNAGGSRTIRRPQPSAGSVPRAQEIRVTRAHIAEARARQASSSEEHCVYIEHSPELEPFHYLKALDRMLGGTAGVIQITKVNGHQLLGLTNRGLAERLISEGLEVEGTLLRAFPFRKKAERITVGNLPFFVGDSAVINALSPYGRVTSIAPKQMKAGPYVYVDGRRDIFITLHEGITIERLPTRLDINIKGEAWPAYLSSGIRCSRCHGQGHRRAICPLLAGQVNNTRMAPPTTPAGVPPPTTPAPPQRSAAQPPAPAPSNPAMEVCSAPPVARAVLHPSAPRPSPPAAPTLPMEETPSAPPPVTPAPSLQVPEGPVGPRSAISQNPEPPPARPDFVAPRDPLPAQTTLGPAAPTPDVEMSIVEETFASSTSSAKNATRVDLDAFIEKHPSVSFAGTDALGLGWEEVLDLLSSRTKAQRKGPLLSPPQCDALASLIGRILNLRSGAASNLYKVLGQVKAELRPTPSAVPTPPLPAPRPSEPVPLTSHGKQLSPALRTPPLPAPAEMEEDVPMTEEERCAPPPPAPRLAEPIPPVPHGDSTTLAMATPPPPLSTQMDRALMDKRWEALRDLMHELDREFELDLEHRFQSRVDVDDIIRAILYPGDREPLIKRLPTRDRYTLGGLMSTAIRRARELDPSILEFTVTAHDTVLQGSPLLVLLHGKEGAIAPLVSHISEFPVHGYRSGSRHRTTGQSLTCVAPWKDGCLCPLSTCAHLCSLTLAPAMAPSRKKKKEAENAEKPLVTLAQMEIENQEAMLPFHNASGSSDPAYALRLYSQMDKFIKLRTGQINALLAEVESLSGILASFKELDEDANKPQTDCHSTQTSPAPCLKETSSQTDPTKPATPAPTKRKQTEAPNPPAKRTNLRGPAKPAPSRPTKPAAAQVVLHGEKSAAHTVVISDDPQADPRAMLKAVRAAHTLPQGVWASLRTKGKLVLHSSNPDTIPAVTTSLANKLDGMKVRQQKVILPRICLFKVDEETSNSTIEETLLETPAVSQLPGDKVVRVAHRSAPRNGTCTAFIEVDLNTFRALGNRGRIVVDGVILNFEESIRARICFRCCGFGHNSAQCTRDPKCFHCGEGGHDGRSCPSAADRRTS